MNSITLENQISKFPTKTDTNYYIDNMNTTSKITTESATDINIISQPDSCEISNNAKLQYDYMIEIKNSNNPSDIKHSENTKDTFISKDSVEPSFIENYTLKYAQMRKKISQESNDNEIDKKLKLLDKAYCDAVNDAAKNLSMDFEKFFNYSYNEWPYGKSDVGSKNFDAESFKNNVISLANTALSVVNQAFKDNTLDNLQANIEDKLSNVKSGTTIEEMNYNDIKEVDNFLKNIPNFKNHKQENFDDGTYKPVPGNWSTTDAANAINDAYKIANDFINSSKASTSTSERVYCTVLKNIDAYHKGFAFQFQSDEYQGLINKDNKYYKLLKEEYEKYEKKLEEAKKKALMKMVFSYLKILSDLTDSLNEMKNKLKDDIDKKMHLSSNPNSVVDTDAYKGITNSENFKESEALKNVK